MPAKLLAIAFTAVIAGGQPIVSGVLNGASYSEVMAPGTWIVVLGSGLANTTATAVSVPLPTILGGASVTIDGQAAPLLYASDTQINALIPLEVTEGDNRKTSVVVTTPRGASAPYAIYLNRRAPALFTRDSSGSGLVHAFDGNFRPADLVSEGNVVILYAAGLGTVSGPLNQITDEVEVFIGEQKAEVLFAGLAPGYPGVYQVNARVPTLWTDRIYLRQSGWISNVGRVGTRPGTNVTRIGTAEIQRVVAESAYSSLTIQGAEFLISVDVAPGAKPFMIATVGEAGGAFTRVDPVNRMWQSFVTAPTTASNHGDFSLTLAPLIDFAQGCQPFPGNKVPPNRLDLRTMYWADYSLPGPEVIFQSYPAGVADRHGAYPSGAAGLVTSGGFADYLRLPCGSQKSGKSTFTIYVDGRAVASQEVTYAISGR